jgi:DNA-binding MarR family transcriptional regulator
LAYAVAGRDDLLFLRLWTAAHRGERLVARELARAGVDGTQLALLLLVAQRRSATTTELAADLGVPFMTASDALGKLEERGDVSREPNPDDRRSQVFALTAAGSARVKATRAPLRRALRALTATSDVPGAELAAGIRAVDEALERALRDDG